MKTKFLRDTQCTDIVYNITLQILYTASHYRYCIQHHTTDRSQTQTLRAEAVAELRHCDYVHPKMINCLALFCVIE